MNGHVTVTLHHCLYEHGSITAIEVSAMGELMLRQLDGRYKTYAAGTWKTAQFVSACATFIVVCQGAAPL